MNVSCCGWNKDQIYDVEIENENFGYKMTDMNSGNELRLSSKSSLERYITELKDAK